MVKKKNDLKTKKLFPDDQRDLFEKSYEEELNEILNRPVECLGITFENDEKRRDYFLEKLREKLKEAEFRKIEGFPIGEDEDILALSDPPYYTACPNPFIEDFIKQYGKPYDPKSDDYRREPFAADVSEGKNDPIYNAHSYHTKVPHKAIMRYILHYTDPGDVVFDGFCGTGMTGVAAQLCGDKSAVESIGYRVDKDGIVYQQDTEEDGKIIWKQFSKLGARRAILNDLSPAATFIAYNYNTPVDVHEFEREAQRILKEVEEECGWMYETLHTDGKTKGRINYTVWSDVFVCRECAGDVVFYEAAVDKEAMKVNKEFSCPHCSASLTKRNMDRTWVTKFDKAINQTIRQVKQVPVLINYSIGNNRYEKRPDQGDLDLVNKIGQSDIPYWFPTERMPEGEESRRNDDIGLTHVHHFFSKRNLWTIAKFNERLDRRTRLAFQSIVATLCSRLVRYNMGHRGNGPLSGTLYVSSLIAETRPTWVFPGKVKAFSNAFISFSHSYTDTQSTSNIPTIEKCNIDYVFTDPPFGGNLMYSELNFLWEAWLKVLTNNKPEAIENRVQNKGLPEYQKLMTECFEEYYRVLKPGRWMTVEFHNSKNSVWNSIQEGLQHAGFVIADVRTLDKQQGTFKQVSSGGAVKQDLIISAYKPNGGLEERFKLTAGTEDGAWDFARTHLKQLPIFVSKDGRAEIIAERQNYLLFDRMVAFHVQRGVTVPMSAAEFYAGLEQRFPPRDGMYFLSDQAAEYDKKCMTVREILQIQLFVSDEASAIQWLKQQLTRKPQTFQDIHPQFLKEIGGWQKYEKPLELSELLKENFLSYDGKGDVPSQIHSYLSSNFKDLRNLEKDDPALKAKAKDRWYVPDPNKAGDLEKLRERALMREFEEYRESKQKRLKVFRLEAVRAGFKKAWQERDYAMIIAVARKIPENILQEDPKLLMWYDQALTRSGEEA
jgi:DNA modification methylase